MGLGTSMVNLSDHKLSDTEKSVLAKCLTFISAPDKSDQESITESINAF